MATEKEITRDYSVTSLVCKDHLTVKQEMCLKTGVSLPIHPFVEEAAIFPMKRKQITDFEMLSRKISSCLFFFLFFFFVPVVRLAVSCEDFLKLSVLLTTRY